MVIKEKQGNEHGAASTYHQLGRVAECPISRNHPGKERSVPLLSPVSGCP
jgi:hypothetical protein